MLNLKYTKNQLEVINFKDGNLQVIACAGSGKTDVITKRIATLIKNGVSPKNILAFTFTEKAAEELKFRVRKHVQELLGHPELGEIYIGTIHSFCFGLLQRFYPKYEAYDILDENKRNLFCYSNFAKIKLNGLGGRSFETIDKFCRSVDVVREELIDLRHLPFNFLDCYNSYMDVLDSEKYLDFSAMMFEMLRMMQEDSDFLEEVKNQYKFVVVDEYQDINKIQEEIIKLITGKNGNLCIVGDDDQCIYQWRGADIKHILKFEENYENVNKIDMTTNFRSSEAIIESAKKLIKKNSDRLEKEIEVWKERKINYDMGDIYEIFFNREEDEVEFIVDRINHLIGTRFVNNMGKEYALSYQDIAIFFRSVKTSADPYIKALKKLKIPFIVKGGGKLFEQDEIKLIMLCLSYIGDIVYGNSTNPLGEIKQYYGECFQHLGDFKKFSTNLKEKKEIIDENEHFQLQILFYEVLNFIGADKFELKETQLYNYGMFSQIISDFSTIYKKIKINQLKEFFTFIKGYGELNYEEGGVDDPTRINAVKIMTIHRAKGLQFPVVFIPNLVQGRFPSTAPSRAWFIPNNLFDIERYEGSNEDERRLFYVAITRSEKYLFITASRKLVGLKNKKNPSSLFKEFSKENTLLDAEADPTARDKSDTLEIQSLKGFPTSFSDLRYYTRCPYDYKMRFIYGFNPEIPIFLGYGKSIHNILSIILTNYQSKPPNDTEIEKIVDEHFFLRYAPEDVAENYKNKAVEMIKNFVHDYPEFFHLVVQTEKPFEFLLDNALIIGVIDLVKKLDIFSNPGEIEVLDFKTHVSSTFAIDYEKQLKIYALAMQKALGITPKKATIHELDDSKQIDVDINQNELDRIEKEIKETIRRIIIRDFPKTPNVIKCEECDWNLFCTKNNVLYITTNK